MVFSSTTFLLLFLPAVICIYYNPIWKGRTFRNVFLFLASIGFYAYGEPVFVFLMLFSILATWALGKLLTQYDNKKFILGLGVFFHVGVLFVFKYLTFFAKQFSFLLNRDSTISIALPIGISFFTFQLLSYLFDVYYGNAKAQKNVLYVGLYVALFPQLIAGPIVRYADIAEEIEHRTETRSDITEGVERFVIGLGKKLLLANYMAVIADNIYLFFETSEISVLTAWLGSIAYTLQIYFDFSGYSDMAIGLGRMFGFHFRENFNYPYAANSVTDFWRRWHISLSSWFRDYIYIPLGGSHVSRPIWIRNLLFVWLLTGIWHGANWTFLVWGLYYFALLLLEKLTGFDEKLSAFSHLYALLAVNIGWVFFRSSTLSNALRYLATMFGMAGRPLSDTIFTSYLQGGSIVLFAAIVFSLPIVPYVKKALMQKSHRLADAAELICIAGLMVLSFVTAISATYNPFIYFNF